MYIEPCCFDKQLRSMSRQPIAYFQTNGDVLVSSFLKALMQCVPGGMLILTMPQVDVPLLRKLYTYLVKDWLSAVVLLTSTDQTELIRGEFGDKIDRVHYAFHSQVIDGQLAMTNFSDCLVLQGAMLIEKDFSLCNYSLSCNRNAEMFKSALHGTVPRLRQQPVIKSEHQDVLKFLALDF